MFETGSTILDWFVSLSLADEPKGRGRGQVSGGGAEVSDSLPTSGSKSGASEQVRQYCFTLLQSHPILSPSHILHFIFHLFKIVQVISWVLPAFLEEGGRGGGGRGEGSTFGRFSVFLVI